MRSQPFLSIAIFCLFFFGVISRSFAASVDLGNLVVGTAPTTTGSEASVISSDEEKELFKKQETVKEQVQKDAQEKESLTKNINYLLIQAYKGKIDKIFGNLRQNINTYPSEVQLRIFRQVSDSVDSKIQIIEKKGITLGTNRKEVLSSVLEYIRSLVDADIVRVQQWQ